MASSNSYRIGVQLIEDILAGITLNSDLPVHQPSIVARNDSHASPSTGSAVRPLRLNRPSLARSTSWDVEIEHVEGVMAESATVADYPVQQSPIPTPEENRPSANRCNTASGLSNTSSREENQTKLAGGMFNFRGSGDVSTDPHLVSPRRRASRLPQSTRIATADATTSDRARNNRATSSNPTTLTSTFTLPAAIPSEVSFSENAHLPSKQFRDPIAQRVQKLLKQNCQETEKMHTPQQILHKQRPLPPFGIIGQPRPVRTHLSQDDLKQAVVLEMINKKRVIQAYEQRKRLSAMMHSYGPPPAESSNSLPVSASQATALLGESAGEIPESLSTATTTVSSTADDPGDIYGVSDDEVERQPVQRQRQQEIDNNLRRRPFILSDPPSSRRRNHSSSQQSELAVEIHPALNANSASGSKGVTGVRSTGAQQTPAMTSQGAQTNNYLFQASSRRPSTESVAHEPSSLPSPHLPEGASQDHQESYEQLLSEEIPRIKTAAETLVDLLQDSQDSYHQPVSSGEDPSIDPSGEISLDLFPANAQLSASDQTGANHEPQPQGPLLLEDDLWAAEATSWVSGFVREEPQPEPERQARSVAPNPTTQNFVEGEIPYSYLPLQTSLEYPLFSSTDYYGAVDDPWWSWRIVGTNAVPAPRSSSVRSPSPGWSVDAMTLSSSRPRYPGNDNEDEDGNEDYEETEAEAESEATSDSQEEKEDVVNRVPHGPTPLRSWNGRPRRGSMAPVCSCQAFAMHEQRNESHADSAEISEVGKSKQRESEEATSSAEKPEETVALQQSVRVAEQDYFSTPVHPDVALFYLLNTDLADYSADRPWVSLGEFQATLESIGITVEEFCRTRDLTIGEMFQIFGFTGAELQAWESACGLQSEIKNGKRKAKDQDGDAKKEESNSYMLQFGVDPDFSMSILSLEDGTSHEFWYPDTYRASDKRWCSVIGENYSEFKLFGLKVDAFCEHIGMRMEEFYKTLRHTENKDQDDAGSPPSTETDVGSRPYNTIEDFRNELELFGLTHEEICKRMGITVEEFYCSYGFLDDDFQGNTKSPNVVEKRSGEGSSGSVPPIVSSPSGNFDCEVESVNGDPVEEEEGEWGDGVAAEEDELWGDKSGDEDWASTTGNEVGKFDSEDEEWVMLDR